MMWNFDIIFNNFLLYTISILEVRNFLQKLNENTNYGITDVVDQKSVWQASMLSEFGLKLFVSSTICYWNSL